MQNFIEAIRNAVGNVGLFVLGLGIAILLLYIWERLSRTEGFIRWRLWLNPKNADLHIALGDLLANVDEYEKAEKEYRLAIELNPKSRQGYYQLYLLQGKTHRKNDAEETVAQIIKLFPEDPVGCSWKGGLLADQDHEKAEEYFRKAISLAPRSSFVFAQYGNFLIRQKRFGEAEVILREACECHPVHPNAHLQSAYTFEQLNKSKDAEKEYRRYIRHNPRSGDGYVYYSNFLGGQDRLAEAEKVITEGIRKNPNDGEAYLSLGALLHKQGRLGEAEATYRRSAELNPEFAGIYFNLGCLLHTQDRSEEAESLYRKAIDLDPTMAKAYGNLGELLQNLNRFNDAEINYRKYIELDPSNARIYDALGNLLRSVGRNEDAVSVFQKALEVDTKDFIALMAIASIQHSLGKYEESKAFAENSRHCLPSDENSWYNMACIEAIVGNTDLAIDNMKKAVQEKSFDKEWAWEDPDLEWIRDDPRFAEIVGPKLEK